MKKKPMKKLLKNLVLLILFIAPFIQACSPTPATEPVTDANETTLSKTSGFQSIEPVLGSATLYIGNFTATSLEIGFDAADTTAVSTLTNISGELGNYNYQNANLAASVRVADSSSIRVSVTSLRTPYFSLENVLCQ
ncbi:hypothetical protein [Brachyspira catarrhinii]|uniref:Uncharacterized protein n=1 Tax=Brachyspira catarrhinii TaxID=2528966 RepID=A0ABY2TV31_9SPIR|nr:hypothetical protein [Brachyspira catarrhinii]TKZ35981.1 hypothetical protein EZH24_02455 [Brachyspira catarrhinii]